MKKRFTPLHFTQAHGIIAKENEIDFFDTNLRYDSLLFVDPFLIKNSPYEHEQLLYGRITKYFKIALDKSIRARVSSQSSDDLFHFLSFPEPKETCLGYTQSSNDGAGLGGDFARALHTFFLGETATRFFSKDIFKYEINPEFFILFADKVAQDGISDLTTNLMMDYLAEYTAKQCKKWGVKTKPLKVNQSFDFKESDWTNGRFFDLPENPLNPEQPVVLVPKRFLRSSELTKANIKSKVKGILKKDPTLKRKFSTILDKQVSGIDREEIKNILLNDDSALKLFIDHLDRQQTDQYDFEHDPLEFYAYKKFLKLYASELDDISDPTSSEQVLSHVRRLIELFRKTYERDDGWRDVWVRNKNGTLIPGKEVAWGRYFRMSGKAYFDRLPAITFDSEVETGRGKLDFRVTYKTLKIAIELKLLKNSSPAGDPKLPAYIHGIKRQLPNYSINEGAKYAFYITGQHYSGKYGKNHNNRANEIRGELTKSRDFLKNEIPGFKELYYENIDLSKKLSFSKA